LIARIWTARTTRDRAPRYAEHLRAHVFPGLENIEGFERAQLLMRDDADGVAVQVITFWESEEAIRRFAGDDVEAAVVPDAAAALLSSYDRRARHFDVVLSTGS
jgi:heme-degrading monooxygenase HmoA